MRLPCPHCGPRDSREFTYGGAADRTRPPSDSTDAAAWCDYVYARDNPVGPHDELWQHTQGCRAWIVVTRDTLTHEVHGARPTARWGVNPVETQRDAAE